MMVEANNAGQFSRRTHVHGKVLEHVPEIALQTLEGWFVQQERNNAMIAGQEAPGYQAAFANKQSAAPD